MSVDNSLQVLDQLFLMSGLDLFGMDFALCSVLHADAVVDCACAPESAEDHERLPGLPVRRDGADATMAIKSGSFSHVFSEPERSAHFTRYCTASPHAAIDDPLRRWKHRRSIGDVADRQHRSDDRDAGK